MTPKRDTQHRAKIQELPLLPISFLAIAVTLLLLAFGAASKGCVSIPKDRSSVPPPSWAIDESPDGTPIVDVAVPVPTIHVSVPTPIVPDETVASIIGDIAPILLEAVADNNPDYAPFLTAAGALLAGLLGGGGAMAARRNKVADNMFDEGLAIGKTIPN